MRPKPKLAVILVLLTLSFSCSDDEYIDPAPQLKIVVNDDDQNPVAGADVVLYGTEESFLTQTDTLQAGKTDTEGICLFTGLEEISYYFHVLYLNDTNEWSVNYVDSLETGKCYIVKTTIN